MSQFSKYFISDQDKFNPINYPEVVTELTILSFSMRNILDHGKVEFLVSFLKNHSVRIDLVKDNPVLADLIRSGTFKFSHVESLFEACREKASFLRDYENYVSGRLRLLK